MTCRILGIDHVQVAVPAARCSARAAAFSPLADHALRILLTRRASYSCRWATSRLLDDAGALLERAAALTP
jgi:hypothetical protein